MIVIAADLNDIPVMFLLIIETVYRLARDIHGVADALQCQRKSLAVCLLRHQTGVNGVSDIFIPVLALGSDFDGIPTNPLVPHAGTVPNLFEVMAKNGIPASVIDKMAGANALRVMKEVLR